jgi:hypothetical protein
MCSGLGFDPRHLHHYGDEFGFDRASNNLTATSEATDLISANKVNANDDVYDLPLAA